MVGREIDGQGWQGDSLDCYQGRWEVPRIYPRKRLAALGDGL